MLGHVCIRQGLDRYEWSFFGNERDKLRMPGRVFRKIFRRFIVFFWLGFLPPDLEEVGWWFSCWESVLNFQKQSRKMLFRKIGLLRASPRIASHRRGSVTLSRQKRIAKSSGRPGSSKVRRRAILWIISGWFDTILRIGGGDGSSETLSVRLNDG